MRRSPFYSSIDSADLPSARLSFGLASMALFSPRTHRLRHRDRPPSSRTLELCRAKTGRLHLNVDVPRPSGSDTFLRLLRTTGASQDSTSNFLQPSKSRRRWTYHPSPSLSSDSLRPHAEAKCSPRATPPRHQRPGHPDSQQNTTHQPDVDPRQNALRSLSARGPFRLCISLAWLMSSLSDSFRGGVPRKGLVSLTELALRDSVLDFAPFVCVCDGRPVLARGPV